jgi:2-isopropylmalate synthase
VPAGNGGRRRTSRKAAGSVERETLGRLKQLEADGYQFESAGASFKLMLLEAMGERPKYFELRDLEVQIAIGADHGQPGSGKDVTRVRIELGVGDEVAYTSARGDGPVHAMDVGLRSLIDRFYPQLASVKLVDYKVRVLTSGDGTGSVVRVLVQSTDGDEIWGTVGVSPNIIHASFQALVDSLDYKLLEDGVKPYEAGSLRPSSRPAKLAVGEP